MIKLSAKCLLIVILPYTTIYFLKPADF